MLEKMSEVCASGRERILGNRAQPKGTGMCDAGMWYSSEVRFIR